MQHTLHACCYISRIKHKLSGTHFVLILPRGPHTRFSLMLQRVRGPSMPVVAFQSRESFKGDIGRPVVLLVPVAAVTAVLPSFMLIEPIVAHDFCAHVATPITQESSACKVAAGCFPTKQARANDTPFSVRHIRPRFALPRQLNLVIMKHKQMSPCTGNNGADLF